MDGQTRITLDSRLLAWKRRRQLQIICATIIGCVSIVLHWGNEDALGWIVLVFIIALAAHDLLFTARRELETMSSAAWSQPEREHLEQAGVAKERRLRLGTEMFAYAGGLGLVVPWLHRAPRAAEVAALVGFIGIGLTMRRAFRG
jgi:hypothetical protein